MNVYKKIQFSLALILVIATYSCDPGVGYNRIVENNSDYDLMIIVYPNYSIERSSYFYESDSFIVAKHSEISIANYSGIGSTNEFDDCNSAADSIHVIVMNNNSLNFTLDLTPAGNWIYTRLSKSFKGGGTCECRIKVDNENIQ